MEYPSGSTMKYKYDKKDNLLEKKRVVDGEVVREINNEYDGERVLVNHRDPSGLMVSGGSGGGSSIDFEKCPGDFRFDTFWECFDEYESRGFHSPGDVCITYCYPKGGSDIDVTPQEITKKMLMCTGICTIVGCPGLCWWLVSALPAAYACQT